MCLFDHLPGATTMAWTSRSSKSSRSHSLHRAPATTLEFEGSVSVMLKKSDHVGCWIFRGLWDSWRSPCFPSFKFPAIRWTRSFQSPAWWQAIWYIMTIASRRRFYTVSCMWTHQTTPALFSMKMRPVHISWAKSMLLSGPFAARRLAACLDILDHLEANKERTLWQTMTNDKHRQTYVYVLCSQRHVRLTG